MISRGLILSSLLVVATGCAGTAVSPICHPGSAAYQQAQAERFDPFPLPDVAPDTATRPLGYQFPASEATRAQDPGTFQQRFGQAPPPGMYRPPRGSGAIQQVPYAPPVLPPPPVMQSPPPFTPIQ